MLPTKYAWPNSNKKVRDNFLTFSFNWQHWLGVDINLTDQTQQAVNLHLECSSVLKNIIIVADLMYHIDAFDVSLNEFLTSF